MATPINDMNPVYDGMGNLVSGTEPIMSVMPPIPQEIRNNPDTNTTTQTSTTCKSFSFFIDPTTFRVVKSGNQHTPDKPWYDSNIEYKYPGAQAECEIYVDVFRCCNDNGIREKVGTVLVARTKQLSYWEECEINGRKGKKIVVRQFVLLDELYSFYREVFRPDPTFLSKNPGFRLPSPEEYVWGACPLQTKPRDLASYLNLVNGLNGMPFQVSKTSITQAKTSDSGTKVNVIPWSAGLPSWTTDPIGRDANGNPTWDVIFTGCEYEGPCEPNAEEPGTPPDFFCITVSSIEQVRQLDAGTSPDVPNGLSTRGRPQYKVVDRGREIILTSAEELFEYNATKVVLDNTRRVIPGTERFRNLSDLGFPCERELIADYQIDVETRYVKLKICYRTDGAILITGGLGDFSAYIVTQPAEKGAPIEGTREYDPQSNCCADADFFPDYASDDPRVMAIPPANRSRLEFDMETAEWVLIDSCECEEVLIADVWCWYKDRRISKVYRKDIKNSSTHVKKRQVIDSRCDDSEVRVFHPFDKKKDIIYGRRKHITKGLFGLQENMLCYLTSSLQSAESKKYYYDVVDCNRLHPVGCNDCGDDPYFAVSYGHYAGSGSVRIDNYDTNKTPSDTVYSQYQLICNDSPIYSPTTGHSLPKFSFVSESLSVESDDVYIINFYRENLSDRLDPGNFQINLSYLSGSFYANSVHTGSNVKVGSSSIMSFIDDSDQYTQGIVCDGGDLISYNLVSGSLSSGIYQNASVNTYGKVYPEMGIIVLHPKRLNEMLGFNTVTGSNIEGDNSFKLLTSISGAASPTTGRTTSHYMAARNITYKSTTHYFVRVFPTDANYSNNPTFVSGSTNQVFDTCFIEDPQTYITSVGLYDSYRQLIAIAKLSRPVKKNFDTDLVIKIRLNW
jgi:hypothetical protein